MLTNYSTEYRAKLKTPEEAVKVVKDGDWVDYSGATGIPEHLDRALAARAEELHGVNVRGYQSLRPVAIAECDPTGEHIRYNSWFLSANERKLRDRGLCSFIPMMFRNMPKIYREGFCKVDVAMIQVSPMDEHGYFYFSMQCAAERALMDVAKYKILEVNENLPHVQGTQNTVHISEIDAVVEGEHGPIPNLPRNAPTESDFKLADYIMEDMHDGICLQLGVGSISDSVGVRLAESDIKDIGVHTELLCEALCDLYKAGKVTNIHKNIDRYKTVFTMVMGSQDIYDWAADNSSVMTTAVDYVNDPAVIGQLDNMVSINNAIEVDLYGQISSESVGPRQISGCGGQMDFLMGAFRSKGGKGYICTKSAYTDKNGVLRSKIVPSLDGSKITSTCTDAYYIVTEYGKVNMMGKSEWQRAEDLIGIAHPNLRDSLIEEAEKLGIWKRSNKR